MADPSANLRVRISADLADIRQGLGVLTRQLREVRTEAARPLPTTSVRQKILTKSVVVARTLGMTKPPRMVLTSGIPEPLAAGATSLTMTTASNP